MLPQFKPASKLLDASPPRAVEQLLALGLPLKSKAMTYQHATISYSHCLSERHNNVPL